ncbi:hypothetical protein EEL30_01100 (plasmid) [Brevibacillus laterosporus]|uniref:Uncharacterized protein n=1 Tax=Brevibacillus laterosporus TaxID=1465 RepID=A0A518V2A1_BRELA|nr:hypothetical protein EEL30_01100 [Brevibacillus laterosporus]
MEGLILMPAIENVNRAMKGNRAEERIPVAKLECDYELATLFVAMRSRDYEQVERSKAKLQELRRELLLLEA